MTAWWTGLLVLAVLLVNGWTDAPNAIAAVVSTQTLSFRKAVLLASLFDFLGAVVMCLFCPLVAETVYALADFGSDPAVALTTLQAALLAIVLWAVLAWRFGIPTSESHALLAGITGACVALHGNFSGVNGSAWGKVLVGLVLSTALGAFAGRWTADRLAGLDLSPRVIRRGQIAGAALTAFFHGAQDGQKFIALFLLCQTLAAGQTARVFLVSLPAAALCAGCMALGTAIGGRRIIDTLSRGLPGLTPSAGLAADLASGGCLLLASLLGLPVSTTHTKVSALWGAGTVRRSRSSEASSIKEIIFTWAATFPGCFLLAWAFARIML